MFEATLGITALRR